MRACVASLCFNTDYPSRSIALAIIGHVARGFFVVCSHVVCQMVVVTTARHTSVPVILLDIARITIQGTRILALDAALRI